MSTVRSPDVDKDHRLHRVKVYRLLQDGTWDDKGTGMITVQILEKSHALGLVVVEETQPNHPLLIHRMSKDLHYQQDETIISWQDAEAASDIAISFEESAGCQLIWEEIQAEQRRHGVNPYQNGKHHMVDEMDRQPSMSDQQNGVPEISIDLPLPEMGNLPQISEALRNLPANQREEACVKLMKDPAMYMRKLLDCFNTAEDLEDMESLQECFYIVRMLLMLNDSELVEVMFSEQNVMDMIGALEYDPNLPEKGSYRQFLRDVVVFKEPVPIRFPEIRAKIHQTYRLGYVRDVVLPRTLDEGAFGTLSSFIAFNNIDVLNALIDEKEVFQDIFKRFKAAEPGSEPWVDIISFLSELASLSKHLQANNQLYMFELLVSFGLFEALSSAIKSGDEKVQAKATDILLISLQNKPTLLRDYLLGPVPKQEPQTGRGQIRFQSPLFDLLVGFLTRKTQTGLQEQVVEILRTLLGSADFERNDFLTAFYDLYMPQLIGIIEKGCDKSIKPEDGPSPQVINLVIEILCYCVHNHQYRIKYYILQQAVMEKVLKVLQRRERWLVCSAIRFIRACLSTKDEFYNRYMVRVNLFEPIISVFVANGEKANLLNSVILEMFHFIYVNGMRNLIDYFMETQYARVEDVDPTFESIKQKWEQMHDRSTETGVAVEQLNTQRLQKDPRALDREEESYFDREDDDDDGQPMQSTNYRKRNSEEGLGSSFPLVDYDDEDLPSPKGVQALPEEPPEKRIRFISSGASPAGRNIPVQSSSVLEQRRTPP